MPSGVTAGFSPTSITANGGISTLTLTVGSGVAAGSYPLTVTGTEGSAVHWVTVSLTVTAATGVPGAPVLTATTNNRGGVQLNWTVPATNGSSITGYNIYRSTTSGGETLLVSVGARTTTYGDTNTVSRTRYYYQVTAVAGIVEGPPSNEASAKAR